MRLNFPGFLSVCILCSICTAVNADLQYRFESKVHYRNSEENRFPVAFPFPPSALPVGESTAFLETVDAGEHVEVSTINLAAKWSISEKVSLQGKVDIIDKYDRNPTSSDYTVDLDNFILRYGKHVSATEIPDAANFYAQLGKFSKFEKQRERRTESYGLVSTAFNRFEDSGVELGYDSPRGYYLKASYTTGNPVFIRDPNMLAGENGTDQQRVPPENPDPELKSGVVILYDAEIEDVNLSDEAELGMGIGYRWNSQDKDFVLDVLAFSYERDLAETRSLNGTFYGGDLDLLDLGDVPGAQGIRLPVVDDSKSESGLNLWLNKGNFSLFSQFVNQDIGGLKRTGKEIELSYIFGSNIKIAPVLRYSDLDNDFAGHPLYPAPSVTWDWQKIDYGVNFDINKSLRIIVEYSDNTFVRKQKDEKNNETVITFIWRHDSA